MQKKNTQNGKCDTDKILRDVASSYQDNWKIMIREPVQNSSDAQGENTVEEIIPEDRKVQVVFDVDTEENSVEYIDKGVGGMSEEVLGEVVTELGGTTKEDTGSGGNFGLGLWATAYLCQKGENGGGMYIESKYEETGKTLSTVLLPEGDCVELEDNSFYGTPSEVMSRTGVSVNNTRPSNWDEGGTLMRLEGVKDKYMDVLSNWDEVKSELVKKFSLLSEQFEIKYIIDGEEHIFSPPTWDEFMGDVLRVEEDLDVDYREELSVDKLVFFEVNSQAGKPWGSGIPLVKTRPHFDNPAMTIKNLHVPGASSVTSKEGNIGAYAIVDSICDEHNKEGLDHDSINIEKFSNKIDVGDIARDVHENNVNLEKDSISEEDMIDACKSGLGDVALHMNDISEDGVEEFGVDYEPQGRVRVSESEGSVEITVENSEDIILSNEYTLEIEVQEWGSGRVTDTHTINISTEDEEQKNLEVDINETPSRVSVELVEDNCNKIASKDSTGVGVQNLGKSGIHRNGGFFNDIEGIDDENLLNNLTITEIEWNNQDEDFKVSKVDSGFKLSIDRNCSQLMEYVTLRNDKKSRNRQKRLIKKEAGVKIVDWMMVMSDPEGNEMEVYDKFQKIKSKLRNIQVEQ
jgi:hypothetical protein